MFSRCQTLAQCEELLEPRLASAELIGEVTVRRQDLDRLLELVDQEKLRFRRNPEESLCRFPHVAAVLLVWLGVYEYKSGAYWPGVERRLGMAADAQGQHYLGEDFRRNLRLWGKPTFTDIGGQVNLTPILAHGGIPDCCLPDFFQHVLRPVLAGRIGRFPVDPYDPDSVIQAVGSLYDTLKVTVDKPVLRFLVYGGPAARDFLLRCVDMAYTVGRGGSAADSRHFGLPDRVVTAFEEWLKRSGDARIPRGEFHRWRRPRIKLNLQRRAVELYLPEQWLPCEMSDRVKLAVSRQGKELKSHSLQLFRSGNQVYSDETAIPLPPSDEYTASIVLTRLNAPDNELQVWPSLPGLRGAADDGSATAAGWGYCVFDGDGMELIGEEPLPRDELWLVAPACSQVVSTGEAQPLAGDWADYAAFPVCPSGDVFTVQFPDRAPLTIAAATSARPRLEGERLSGVSCCGDPVFAQPPVLLLPDESWLRRHLVVRTLAGQAASSAREPICDLEREAVDGEQTAVDLDQVSLLKDAALGHYSFRVEGPLGEDFMVRFSLVRDLNLRFGKPLYCPDAADEPVQVRGTADHRVSLFLEGERLTNRGLEVPPGQHNVRLHASVGASMEARGGDALSLRCVLPRVRLHLSSDDDPIPEISTSPLGISIQDLREHELQLLVVAPSIDEGVAELRIAGECERVPIAAGQALFRLSRFADSVSQASADVVQAQLLLHSPRHPSPLAFVVLTVERSWGMSEARCTALRRQGKDLWLVSWRQTAAPENRALRVWNLWRPWEHPVQVEVTGKASSCEIDPEQLGLTAAEYLLQPIVVDQWLQPRMPGIPPVGARGSDRCTLGNTKQRRAHLASSRTVDEVVEYAFANSWRDGRGRLRACNIRIEGMSIASQADAEAVLYTIACCLMRGAVMLELRHLMALCGASGAPAMLQGAFRKLRRRGPFQATAGQHTGWQHALEAAGMLCGIVEMDKPAEPGDTVEYWDREGRRRGVLDHYDVEHQCPRALLVFAEHQTDDAVQSAEDRRPYPVYPTRWHLITKLAEERK